MDRWASSRARVNGSPSGRTSCQEAFQLGRYQMGTPKPSNLNLDLHTV